MVDQDKGIVCVTIPLAEFPKNSAGELAEIAMSPHSALRCLSADFDGDILSGNYRTFKCRIKKGPNKGTFRYVRIALKQYKFGNITPVVFMEIPKTIEDCAVFNLFPRGNGPLSSEIDWSKPVTSEFMPLSDCQQMVVPHLQPKEL